MKENARLQQILQMLRDEPEDSFLRFAAALEYEKMNQPELAQMYFEQILNNDPAYVAVYLHLGNLYARLNKPEEAKKTYMAGIKQCTANDSKTRNELLAALQELY